MTDTPPVAWCQGFKVCDRCDPERFQRKCRRRWWRREKCRPRFVAPPFLVIPDVVSGLGFPQTEAARRRAARAERRYFEEAK